MFLVGVYDEGIRQLRRSMKLVVVLEYVDLVTTIPQLVCESVGNGLHEGARDPADGVVVRTDGRPPALQTCQTCSTLFRKDCVLTVSSFFTTSRMSFLRKES